MTQDPFSMWDEAAGPVGEFLGEGPPNVGVELDFPLESEPEEIEVRDAEGRVNVTLCNTDPSVDHDVRIDVRGAPCSKVAGRVLTDKAITAHNTFDAPNTVKPADFDGAKAKDGTVTLKAPSKSVLALTIS